MAHIDYPGSEIPPYSEAAALPAKKHDGVIMNETLERGIHLPPDVRQERGDDWKHDIIRGQFHNPSPRSIVPIRVSVALLAFTLAALLIVLFVVFFDVDRRRQGSN